MVSHAAPPRRRRWLIAGAALVVVAAAVSGVVVQVRATGEAVRAEQQAALEALDRHWATFGQVHEDRLSTAVARSRAEQQAVVDGAVLLAWSAGSSSATAQVAAAAEMLASTEGEVADDAVRTAVADAAAVVTATLDEAATSGSAAPAAPQVAALSASVTTLRAAMATLDAAHAQWRAARAAQSAARPRTSYSGDCGGSGSFEGPVSSGSNRFYTSVPTEDGDGTNGNLPRSAMTALSWCVDSAGHAQWLRSDAAAALTRLNEAFRAQFGENIAIDLSYRSYADQVRAKELFGGLAATPGTSNHGWGTAIDTWEWDAYDFGSERYEWLVAHGPEYGWYCPAATSSSNPEYWHYEYRG